MKRSAVLSPCGAYRYRLDREVEPTCQCSRCTTAGDRPGYVLFVLNNPSVADAQIDDPTERRGWGFARAWGYRHFVFMNCNPFRSTDPKLAQMPPESVLSANGTMLWNVAVGADRVVCAWGAGADRVLASRTQYILKLATSDRLYHLGLTKDGIPKHPLYLRSDSPLHRWAIL